MKNLTVQRGVSQRAVEDDGVTSWVNKEASVILNQARTALNYRTLSRFEVTTAGDAAWNTIWTSEAMPTTGTWHIRGYIAGVSTDGSAERAGYTIEGLFESTAGTVAQFATTTLFAYETTGPSVMVNAQFSVDASARTISIQVRDNGVNSLRYVCETAVLESLP